MAATVSGRLSRVPRIAAAVMLRLVCRSVAQGGAVEIARLSIGHHAAREEALTDNDRPVDLSGLGVAGLDARPGDAVVAGRIDPSEWAERASEAVPGGSDRREPWPVLVLLGRFSACAGGLGCGRLGAPPPGVLAAADAAAAAFRSHPLVGCAAASAPMVAFAEVGRCVRPCAGAGICSIAPARPLL